MNPSTDTLTTRNNTLIVLTMNGQRVGRVQQFSEEINNNVQVLAEIGRDYMVELQRGIVSYTFSMAKFLARADVFDDLKLGKVFGLAVTDTGAGNEVIEYFPRCMMSSVSLSWAVGQAAVGVNAQVAVVGKGVEVPILEATPAT